MKKILFAHIDAPDHFYPADEVVHRLVDNFVDGFHDLASLSVTFSDGTGLIFRIDTSDDTSDPLGSSVTSFAHNVSEALGTCVVTETPNGLEATLTIDPAKTEFINWIQSDSPPPKEFKDLLNRTAMAWTPPDGMVGAWLPVENPDGSVQVLPEQGVESFYTEPDGSVTIVPIQPIELTISEDDFIVSPAVRNLTGGWSEEGGNGLAVDHTNDYKLETLGPPPDPGMTENLKPVPEPPPRNWTKAVRRKRLGKYHDPR